MKVRVWMSDPSVEAVAAALRALPKGTMIEPTRKGEGRLLVIAGELPAEFVASYAGLLRESLTLLDGVHSCEVRS